MDPTLEQSIRRAGRSGKLPHSVIFSGSGDLTAAARFYAAALECTQQDRPCLRCPACSKVLRGIHPDVITAGNDDGKDLSVEALRALRSDAFIQPNEGACKVFLFPDCRRLTVQDQNVLLKLVEEGPPYAAFLFCTETAAALLPTIRSRCVEWKLRGEDEDARDDAARDLCRAFASGQLLPVSQYLVGLENKRLKREQLQQLLENAWRASAEALLAACGKPDPADIPGAEELRRGLTVRQLQGMTDLMKQYCLECRYNVGVGHVLGALCAGWEKLL